MDEIFISGRRIADDEPPYIVAEIGQNHNGDVYTATKMIGMAVRCGADAVKFQLRSAEHEIAATQLDRPHPNPHNAFGETYREHRNKLDLNKRDLAHIGSRIEYNEWPIHWFATPCWIGAVEELEKLNVPAYKIASKDLTNIPLIMEAASTGKPVILSTGMADLNDIELALNAVYQFHDESVVMQCTSQYPCDNVNANIAAMINIQDVFDCLVGFSDHTIGILAPALAVSHGAVIIEKHITLSRAMPGTDHAAAVEEEGLRRIVRDCHAAKELMGDYHKEICEATVAARDKLAGSLVCSRQISRGETISIEDLTLKAPGNGLRWKDHVALIGKAAVRDLGADEQIKLEDVV